MKKKLIAWLLVICMAISLLPAAALYKCECLFAVVKLIFDRHIDRCGRAADGDLV